MFSPKYSDGSFEMRPIDYSKGYIQRTPDHARGSTQRPISIVVDAFKTG